MKTAKTAILLIILFALSAGATTHPNLLLTPDGVAQIRQSLSKYPSFNFAFQKLKNTADSAQAHPMEVPVPKDGGGGYTHEKHKSNYFEMVAAATAYQLTGNERYARFVADMLLKYAQMYPSLGLHPVAKSESTGKLFWQTLNDAVWLVNAAQAYDGVYNFMTSAERQKVEKNLFYPMAEFLMNGTPDNFETFNKMHNHGTWSLAAVGMIGYVMNDRELVQKALYGSAKDGRSGFIKQMNTLFSPDGYYTEGSYYQRYAISPFMIFAQCIDHQQPELKIFDLRDHILLKATHALLQSAYNDNLFTINDALWKNYFSQEIVQAVDIAYAMHAGQNDLLDIARKQNDFIISDAGFKTAKAVVDEPVTPFVLHSVLLRDGAAGDEGALAILRAGQSQGGACFTLKATAHGLSHGHYDKLSLAFFDNNNAVLPDYGSVRFLNVEAKDGGRYTRENHSWALQTIAHNTVVVDETSHFDGNIAVSSRNHSDILYYNDKNSACQVVSAQELHASDGVKMSRTIALIQHRAFTFPVVLDLFRVNTDAPHTLDLPYYYIGQLVSCNFEVRKNTSLLKPLGKKNGYQHLWLEASARCDSSVAHFTWLNENRFYTITSAVDTATQLILTRLGANDPNFNLRPETGFMLRRQNQKNYTFVSLIEPHGNYDLIKEVTSGDKSAVKTLKLLVDNDDFTAVKVILKTNAAFLFVTVNRDFGDQKKRSLLCGKQQIEFTGNFLLREISDRNN